MVSRFLHLVRREIGGLHAAALILGLSSLTSQILALFRDRLLAGQFGASINLDIYYAAFRLPDLLYVTVASFVSVTVIIPFLINHLRDEDKTVASEFLDSVATVFLGVMLIVGVVLFILMPLIAPLIAPGFDQGSLDFLTKLSRILLLSPILLGLSNLVGAVTQAYKKFFAYALSPVFYNLGIIIGVVLFFPLWGLSGLAWGVVLGAVFHLLVQWPVLRELKLFPGLTSKIAWREVGNLILVSVPRTLALATQQISLLVLVSLASLMGKGSISVFNLASNLQSVPLSLIGISYSVAAFPVLAAHFSGGRKEEFMQQIVEAARHIIFWSMPAVVLFIVLRAQIVRTILGYGSFDWGATKLTAAALAIFVVSMAAQALILLLVRGFYAAGRTKIPLIANVSSAIVIIVSALGLRFLFEQSELFRFFLEGLLRVENVQGVEMLVLPLGFSLGVFVNLFGLWFLFEREFGAIFKSIWRALRQSFSAAVIAGFVAYQNLFFWGGFLNLNKVSGIFLQGFLAGIVGVVVFLVILAMLDNAELRELTTALHRRFWRARPILPDQGEL